MNEIKKILDDNEKVLWDGKPQLTPFVASTMIISVFGLSFLGFSLIWMIGAFATSVPFGVFGLPFTFIGFLMTFGAPLYRIMIHQYTYYAITNKRVIIQGGLIGRDFKIVDFDKIQNADVNVGIFDKMFGSNSGSINIHTAGTFVQGKYGPIPAPYSLSNITDPYKAFGLLKITSHDVKTDIEYPNKLRPSENPGYKTDYKSTK